MVQCQSQLKSLYAEGIEGCHMEFSAYNLLCVILHSNNNRDLLSSMARSVTKERWLFILDIICFIFGVNVWIYTLASSEDIILSVWILYCHGIPSLIIFWNSKFTFKSNRTYFNPNNTESECCWMRLSFFEFLWVSVHPLNSKPWYMSAFCGWTMIHFIAFERK